MGDDIDTCALCPAQMDIGYIVCPACMDDCKQRRAADLTDEEREALSLVPGVLEQVFRRAQLESIVNGEPDPKREKIDLAIAAIAKLLAARGGE